MVKVVRVIEQGPQGPQGPQGDSGDIIFSYSNPDLLLCWDHTNRDSAATTIFDSSADILDGPFNATINGSLSFSSDVSKISDSGVYAGGSRFLSIASDPALSFSVPFTIVGAFKTNTIGLNDQTLLNKYELTGNQREYAINILGTGGGGSGELQFIVSPDGTFTNAVLVTTALGYDINFPVMVVAEFIPSTSISLYINFESEIVTNTVNIPATLHAGTAPLQFGRLGSVLTADFLGNSGTWRIFKNRILTRAERLELYHGRWFL